MSMTATGPRDVDSETSLFKGDYVRYASGSGHDIEGEVKKILTAETIIVRKYIDGIPTSSVQRVDIEDVELHPEGRPLDADTDQ